jgi:hypothetical protein
VIPPVCSLRGVLTLFALLVLAACSSTQLVYDNGATLMRWRATSYLDVHGAQAKDLERRIERFLAWHRATALPQYARLAESSARRVERGLTRADLEWGYDAFRTQLEESLRVAAREIAPLMDSLTPEQIAHLEQRIAEDNREYAEDNLDGDEAARRRQRMERNVTRLEEWVGPLSAAQRAAVRRYSETAPLTGALRASDRVRRQAALLEIVRAHAAQRRLADWAAGWDQERAPAYAAASRGQREAYYDMLLAIDRGLSPEQRASAAARFRRFAEEFQLLAKAGGTDARAQ